ncbi:MAG: FtsX-like permease family protein [Chitinophagia bacterium]|jgi:cell division transport system permease protein|nr:FtsX-like permease family protein [Chitinophagia bacterium]
MASTGTSALKRSKPNYIYSIVGVAIVLFIMGIMGWLFLNLQSIGDSFKEDIRISVYVRTADKNTVGAIEKFIASQPYAKNVEYINKEKAKEIWNKENNEDWAKILDSNPLPESVDFFAKADYVNTDSLSKITAAIENTFSKDVADIQYPKNLVTNLNERATKIGIIFLVMSIILCIIVIISIDNTIRLAMYSNRFLIKTMQMVGATRNFISKPLLIRALLNGLISAFIAIFLLFGLIEWATTQFPQIGMLQGISNSLILFGGLILLGVGISVFSTYRSVLKYLKMKLDELY